MGQVLSFEMYRAIYIYLWGSYISISLYNGRVFTGVQAQDGPWIEPAPGAFTSIKCRINRLNTRAHERDRVWCARMCLSTRVGAKSDCAAWTIVRRQEEAGHRSSDLISGPVRSTSALVGVLLCTCHGGRTISNSVVSWE